MTTEGSILEGLQSRSTGKLTQRDTYPAMPSELVPTEGDPKQLQVSSDKASTPGSDGQRNGR